MSYFGAGFQAGACGVTIDRITTAHNGQHKCSLFDSDRSNEGFINVVVAGTEREITWKRKRRIVFKFIVLFQWPLSSPRFN